MAPPTAAYAASWIASVTLSLGAHARHAKSAHCFSTTHPNAADKCDHAAPFYSLFWSAFLRVNAPGCWKNSACTTSLSVHTEPASAWPPLSSQEEIKTETKRRKKQPSPHTAASELRLCRLAGSRVPNF
eukprot:500976-Pelagomonas_calceolata.AAC.3